MKRWLVRICVFLLLGAIVNVAVAWGTVLHDPPDYTAGFWREDEAAYSEWREWRRIRFHVREAFGRARASCTWDGPDAVFWARRFLHVVEDRSLEDVVPAWAVPALPSASDSRTAFMLRILDLRGWPCRSLRSHYESISESKGPSKVQEQRHRYVGCMSLPDRSGTFHDASAPRLLPLRPLWPGFAINTVFYAVILWLLFAGPFVVRRWRRIRRGLCPKCAYDLRGTPEATACPECGATR